MFRVPLVYKREFHFLRKDSFKPNLTDIALEFLEMGDKVSLKVKVGKFLDFVINISIESFPSTKGNMSKKNFYKCL